ncbi:ABC transporter ATP-binding protein [Pseudomonas sp. 10B1]|uniref:ABC transporter ATP-binding protein n=1 Tax=unclassified Pseudomonas TaxID=196821 RepID=UPI002B23B479|nr:MULTISPECIES: ABC transporter ATP-binding protein [unclassified Pseudomonas]MEA9979122.1 ABC transporter ATP-binding protein [Pseudomonas sp. RTS4]MEA9996365.1 ABC transporter ATP-binding protein [Pseudomonas sp. AA4]MEB0085829.1 ABC transporter ATP-binding protein [Pseudomonas sp. RTI1]MEB0125846.1 ABC transporter ATP-binding protein [Pseudomonas sp. CCC1.2]MEB0154414.1 ABC transporter ATP-binding protein [Pseudomonas sp. CCC4.3]
MTGLILENVEKYYGSACAVTDVNLHLPEGKLVCFLGPSGCGKTTLLRMIAGLETLTSGEIRLDGEDVSHTPAHQRNFGMVFQSLALFPHMTVGENIAYPLKLRGVNKADQQGRVKELLELIQLQAMIDRPVAKLSGGQRQRVAIARAIASHPKLLLLDEPLSALDAKLRESMQVEIRQLQQRLNITTILVTHDQREAMTMADIVVVLGQNRVQQVGTPIEIYRNPANEFVADFIGSGNIFPATVLGEGRVGLPTGEALDVPISSSIAVGAQIKMLVRPEDLQLSPPLPTAGNRLLGTVTFVRDIGATIETTVECAGVSLTALSTPSQCFGLAIGHPVSVTIPAEACRVLAA